MEKMIQLLARKGELHRVIEQAEEELKKLQTLIDVHEAELRSASQTTPAGSEDKSDPATETPR